MKLSSLYLLICIFEEKKKWVIVTCSSKFLLSMNLNIHDVWTNSSTHALQHLFRGVTTGIMCLWNYSYPSSSNAGNIREQ